MELVACFLIAMLITAGRGVTDGIHAVKGTTPARIEARRERAERARERAAERRRRAQDKEARSARRRKWRGDKPGLSDYLAVRWGDAWETAIEHHNRVRAEKRAGTRPPAGQRLKRFGRLLVDPVPTKAERQAKADAEQAVAPKPAVAEPVTPPPAPEPVQPKPAAPAPKPELSKPQPVAQPQPTKKTGGPIMATDIVNYATANAALDEIADKVRTMQDYAAALVANIEASNAQIDALDTARQPAADTATAIQEGLTAVKVDATSLSSVGEAVDGLSADSLIAVGDHMSGALTAVQAWQASLETAAAGIEAARANVVSTYGEAAETVASTGVDAKFLQAA